MNQTKLIATYCRVSTARQEDEQTIKNQQLVLQDFANRNSYTIVREYIDEGWSGDILARPGLDALRQDRKSKLWQAVLIYDPDRLARRYSYQELVMDELKEAGIELLFVTVAAPKNSEDKILHGVRGLFAEYERTKIAERFRLGKLRKIKEGNIFVSRPLYGYTYVLKNDHKPGYYVINQSEAEVVRQIFSWVGEEGLTLRKVVSRLKELEILPRNSKRGIWATSTLSTMLRHRGYIGEAHWGSSYAVEPEKPLKIEQYKRVKKSSRRIKAKDEWFIIQIPSLVSKDLFERVQLRLQENFLNSQKTSKNQYLLAGKIKCICGNSRGGEGPQNGKYLYYRCTNRVVNHPLPRSCFEPGIEARSADALVWNHIVALMTSPDLLKQQLQRYKDDYRRTKVNIDKVGINSEIKKLKEEEHRYNKAYGGGLFELSQLQEYTEPLLKRIAFLQNQLSQAQKELVTRLEVSKSELDRFAQQAFQVLKDLKFESKREIVRSVVSKVVGNSKELIVSGYIPIKNIDVISEDRYRLNTPRHSNSQAMDTIPFEIEVQLKTLICELGI